LSQESLRHALVDVLWSVQIQRLGSFQLLYDGIRSFVPMERDVVGPAFCGKRRRKTGAAGTSSIVLKAYYSYCLGGARTCCGTVRRGALQPWLAPQQISDNGMLQLRLPVTGRMVTLRSFNDCRFLRPRTQRCATREPVELFVQQLSGDIPPGDAAIKDRPLAICGEQLGAPKICNSLGFINQR